MSTQYSTQLKLFTGIGISLFLLMYSCGKKFESPNGNEFLAAEVTATPLTVAPDSLVTITGQGFSPDPLQDQVFFNGKGAAVLQASATQLVVKVPAQGSTGTITVRVNGEQANGPVFTYPGKSAFAISPSSGIGGTTVTLTGSKVGPLTGTTVNFGSRPAKVLYTDSTRIIVTAPDSVQTTQLTITTNGNQYSGPVFTLCSITSISPMLQGAGAGTLRIIGTGFNPIPGQNTVNFPTNPKLRILSADTVVVAPVIRGNADTLVVNIPSNAGTGIISVNPNGQNTIAGPVFTLFAITGLNAIAFPYVASSGFQQLLTGNGFNTDVTQNHLTVNGLSCTVSYVSPTGDSILFYPPDLTNPSRPGTANGPIVLQSGALTTTYTISYSNNTNPMLQPISYVYQGVSTLAGGSFGLANGKGRQAQFETLSGIVAVGSTLYVTDRQANNIRAITSDGNVTLVAGSPTGQAGYQDGIGAATLFNTPCGIATDNNNDLYIADSGNFRIRKINLSTYQVTTLSGTGVQGSVDGPGAAAQFQGPNSISLVSSTFGGGPSTYYITDAAGGQGTARKVIDDGTGTVSTLQSGLTNPSSVINFGYPKEWGLAYFANQAFYIPSLGGLIAGVPGTSGFQNAADATTALFNDPAGSIFISVAIPGGVYPNNTTSSILISDQDNNVIRVVDLTYYPNGPYPVSTYIGGMGGTTAGYQEGGYRTALFNRPGALTSISNGGSQAVTYYYVCDVGNHAIRVFN
ncbi:MAG TPA: IPT/TIG domain-containing protein [Puia sp.]|nr:IPT/TIG domain-containing protein [Puia sp.]